MNAIELSYEKKQIYGSLTFWFYFSSAFLMKKLLIYEASNFSKTGANDFMNLRILDVQERIAVKQVFGVKLKTWRRKNSVWGIFYMESKDHRLIRDSA